MPEYTYIARDRAGRTVQGTVQAANSAIAAGKLREMGYVPERVRAAGGPAVAERPATIEKRFAEAFVFPVVSGVPLKALVVFYRQFATLIDAGIPLYQALSTLQGQTRNTKLQAALRDCQAQVLAGGQLSEALAKYPWIFTGMQVEMIRAAERGGLLDEMLKRIADYLEQELDQRRMLGRLTLYPKIVAFVGFMLLGKRFFVDAFPAFAKLIVGQGYGLLDYLNDTVFFMAEVGLVIFAIVAFSRIVLFQADPAREAYERFKFGLPGLGNVSRGFALARFGRAFGAMYGGGLPMTLAVRVGGRASGSRIVAHATERASEAAEQGLPLSQVFAQSQLFPSMVIDMLHTGEQTGNVDSMMAKCAEYLEGEASSKAHLYSHVFSTVVYLIVAVAVAMAVIRFYGGLFSGIGAAAEGGGE